MYCLRRLMINEFKLSNFKTLQNRCAVTFMIKGVHEPHYLDYLNPLIPYYPLLNIQFKGYDYAVLESFASHIHRLSNRLGINVCKFWCAPHAASKYESLQLDSNAVENTYMLNLYERNLQVKNLSAKMAPIFIETIQSSLPAGVYISIHQHDIVEHEESRYIPDLQLASLKVELKDLQNDPTLNPIIPKK